MSKVSIIVPNYNGEQYLNSIVKVLQPYYDKGFEIILSDDGSNSDDNTCTLFKKNFPNSIVVKQTNKGVAAARNLGASVATGEYLQLLDIDDSITPDKIERQIEFAVTHNFDVVYSDWQMAIMKDGKTTYEDITISGERENILNSLVKNWWQPPHSYLIKKSAYNDISGSDETLINAQDFDLVVRMALNDSKYGYLPGNFSTYFRYLDNTSLARGPKKTYWESYDRSLDKCLLIANQKNLLDYNLKEAFASRYFYVARNAYKIDSKWGLSIIEKVNYICPKYKPENESNLYKLSHRIFGYEISEKLANFKARFV